MLFRSLFILIVSAPEDTIQTSVPVPQHPYVKLQKWATISAPDSITTVHREAQHLLNTSASQVVGMFCDLFWPAYCHMTWYPVLLQDFFLTDRTVLWNKEYAMYALCVKPTSGSAGVQPWWEVAWYDTSAWRSQFVPTQVLSHWTTQTVATEKNAIALVNQASAQQKAGLYF